MKDKYVIGSRKEEDEGYTCYKKISHFGSYYTFEKDDAQLFNLIQDVYEVTLWIEIS